MADIYEKLRERLDQIGKGFPASERGAELNYLKQLFSTEDAEFFLAMGEDYETPTEFALRTGVDPEVAAIKLETMSKRGLLYRIRNNGEVKYLTPPIVHGIAEFNLKNLDKTLVKNYNRTFVGSLGMTLHSTQIPLFRTVPIQTEIVSGSVVLPYDNATSVVTSAKVISVADCICRKISEFSPKACTHITETCLCFDDMADYYVENEIGRYISKEEALEVIKRSEEEGLVFNVSNSKRVEVMCCCCSCCCGLLISQKVFGGDSRQYISNYICRKDDSLCTDCEICLERCPVKAYKVINEQVQLNVEKCIGCGLCVTTCPTNAVSLVKKPDDKVYEPPQELFYDTCKDIEKLRKES